MNIFYLLFFLKCLIFPAATGKKIVLASAATALCNTLGSLLPILLPLFGWLLLPRSRSLSQSLFRCLPFADYFLGTKPCQKQMLFLDCFSEACSQPLLLLFDGHVAVVQQESVFRLAKRTYFAVLVDVVTFLHVGQDFLE